MVLKLLIVVSVFIGFFVVQSNADCYIEPTSGGEVKPIFFKNILTATALVANQTQGIHLANYEEIVGHCATSFVGSRSSDSQIRISCNDDDEIVVTDSNGEMTYERFTGQYDATRFSFECSPGLHVPTICRLPQYPLEGAVHPKFFKKIGSRTMQLGAIAGEIWIKNHQVVTARCDTKFKSPNHLSPQLNLICLDGRLVAFGHPFDGSYSSIVCESLQWNLYESVQPFPWCRFPLVSYVLARPWFDVDYEYVAGICFNIDEMSFKSLYYAAKPRIVKFLSPKILETFKSLMQITDIGTNFVSKRTFKYTNPQVEQWIKFSDYKIDSIVRNPRLYRDIFQQFAQLLVIDWWPGLKLGNWQRYEEALTRHIESGYHEYDILAGISQTVAAPIHKENCYENLTMTALADDANNKLPLYIWNYLKSTNDSGNEVVIIGVNSPFYDFFDENDLVFCQDMCHQLDWLENIQATFRYRPMGVMFCCSAQEVVASGRLDGFAVPKEWVQPPRLLPIINYSHSVPDTTTAMETDDSTAYDETTEREQEYDDYGNLY